MKDTPVNSKGNDCQETDTHSHMCMQVHRCACVFPCACAFVSMHMCMAMHVLKRQKKRSRFSRKIWKNIL